MDRSERAERPSMRRAAIGAGILVVMQFAIALVVRRSGGSEAGMFTAAGLTALALLGIGALNLRHTTYPRWAYVSMVVIMAAAALLTPVTAASPEAWSHRTRDGLWLMPWFLVTLSMLPPPRRGACAADHPAVGWFMVGTSVLLSVIVQVTGRLSIF